MSKKLLGNQGFIMDFFAVVGILTFWVPGVF